MPKPKPEVPSPVPVSIYLHERVSLGFGMLLEVVFSTANRLAGREAFSPGFVCDRPGPLRFPHGISMRGVSRRLHGSGYLLIPPLEPLRGDFRELSRETRFVRAARERGLVVATACLGSFIPAAAGLLDDCEATTHWRWGDYARQRFPNVNWDPRALLCSAPGILTAGGLLSTIDLGLHLVSRHCPKKLCRELGRNLLADSIRQRQSVYAASLVLQPRDQARFRELEETIERSLARPPTIPEMANLCGMSLRSFHRAFSENYGLPPGKYLQLKRVERAKALLADSRLSIEEVSVGCGFSQTGFFRSIFTRETGLTPARFRKQL